MNSLADLGRFITGQDAMVRSLESSKFKTEEADMLVKRVQKLEVSGGESGEGGVVTWAVLLGTRRVSGCESIRLIFPFYHKPFLFLSMWTQKHESSLSLNLIVLGCNSF